MFFRGYVETKDKQCVEKFKGRTDFKTYEQVKSLPEFAGILAEDTILVDLDDEESSDVLFKVVQDYSLNCRVYRTTRGKHFLFKNSGVGGCKTHCTLAIGLKADIKVGVKSSYEVLKYGGVEREILYDTAENEQAQPLPRWLFPVRSKMAFLDMEEGDGRNQALFNYILTLQSNDFTVEEARETIRIINKYVLKVPLSNSEIETILRDDSFKKPVFYNGSTFLFDKFAIFLKNNAHIIKINNQLHIYKDGIYTAGYGEIEAAMIKHIPDLNRAKRSEVVDYLDLLIRDNTKPEDAHLIAFKNGLYNIIDGSFAGFTPEHIITNKIPWDYTPDATCPLVDNVLNRLSCNDAEIRALLEEVAGACLYRDNKLGGGNDDTRGGNWYADSRHSRRNRGTERLKRCVAGLSYHMDCHGRYRPYSRAFGGYKRNRTGNGRYTVRRWYYHGCYRRRRCVHPEYHYFPDKQRYHAGREFLEYACQFCGGFRSDLQ